VVCQQRLGAQVGHFSHATPENFYGKHPSLSNVRWRTQISLSPRKQRTGVAFSCDCSELCKDNARQNKSRVDINDIDSHWALADGVRSLYREHLVARAKNPWALEDSPRLERLVDNGWRDWFKKATGPDCDAIELMIDRWLNAEPDWCNEWENFYKTGNAQGAAYDHFLSEHPDVLEALDIVIIEGDCPGSTYFAAELHMTPQEANEIAEARGGQIRFVTEG
jgi:hypothetical protein